MPHISVEMWGIWLLLHDALFERFGDFDEEGKELIFFGLLAKAVLEAIAQTLSLEVRAPRTEAGEVADKDLILSPLEMVEESAFRALSHELLVHGGVPPIECFADRGNSHVNLRDVGEMDELFRGAIPAHCVECGLHGPEEGSLLLLCGHVFLEKNLAAAHLSSL